MSQIWACFERMEPSKETLLVGGTKQQRYLQDPKIMVKKATMANCQESLQEGANLSWEMTYNQECNQRLRLTPRMDTWFHTRGNGYSSVGLKGC